MIEISNLNRQIIHNMDDIGTAKPESARKKFEKLNPHTEVISIQEKITENNIHKLTYHIDIIIDAMDNFKTRKILNQISINRNIAFIFGEINGFTGMLSTFIPGKTPCFECIHTDNNKNNENVGVIVPIPGTIASMQSLEAIKLILNLKMHSVNKLIYFNGLDLRMKK